VVLFCVVVCGSDLVLPVWFAVVYIGSSRIVHVAFLRAWWYSDTPRMLCGQICRRCGS
jgi:hypothetical protein